MTPGAILPGIVATGFDPAAPGASDDAALAALFEQLVAELSSLGAASPATPVPSARPKTSTGGAELPAAPASADDQRQDDEWEEVAIPCFVAPTIPLVPSPVPSEVAETVAGEDVAASVAGFAPETGLPVVPDRPEKAGRVEAPAVQEPHDAPLTWVPATSPAEPAAAVEMPAPELPVEATDTAQDGEPAGVIRQASASIPVIHAARQDGTYRPGARATGAAPAEPPPAQPDIAERETQPLPRTATIPSPAAPQTEEKPQAAIRPSAPAAGAVSSATPPLSLPRDTPTDGEAARDGARRGEQPVLREWSRPVKAAASAPVAAFATAGPEPPRAERVATATPVEPAAMPGTREVLPQIVRAIQVQVRQGVGEAVVRLRPEHLGEVRIALTVERGGVSAVVHAERADVRSQIVANIDSLKEQLASQGLRLDDLVVREDGRHQGDGQHGGDQPAHQRRYRRPPPRAFELAAEE